MCDRVVLGGARLPRALEAGIKDLRRHLASPRSRLVGTGFDTLTW